MAQQDGIIQIKGTLGNITFFKTKSGFHARRKTSMDGARIANDPAFLRTRENMSEFSSTATASKMLRDALRPFMMSVSDSSIVSRMMKLFTAIKKLDTVSARGERNVGAAIGSVAAKALLKGFDFNSNAGLGAVLFAPYSVTPLTGVIKIPNLIPINNISPPPAATHVTIKGAWARVDFTTGISEVQATNLVNLPIDGASTNVVLTPLAVPAGVGTDLYLLQLEFYQEVNGILYSLKNGSFNPLTIIELN